MRVSESVYLLRWCVFGAVWCVVSVWCANEQACMRMSE